MKNPQIIEPAELLTPLEVCEVLRIEPRTLEEWRSNQTGPNLPFLRIGRMIRYRRADLDRLLADSLQLIVGGAA